jgi:limonene-1,2-epoxide hydrolase
MVPRSGRRRKTGNVARGLAVLRRGARKSSLASARSRQAVVAGGRINAVSPADVVAAVFEAMRADDLDAAVALFSEDCVIRAASGTYAGRDGVRAWRASRAAGAGPPLTAGEPEAVDATHVLVPLTAEIEMNGSLQSVRVTGVWMVVDGLVTEVRGVPGGRRMALTFLRGIDAEDVQDLG